MTIRHFKDIINDRAYRISSKDRDIFERGSLQSFFGLSDDDMIEFILYDANDNQLPQGESGKLVRYVPMSSDNIRDYFLIEDSTIFQKFNFPAEYFIDVKRLIHEAGYNIGKFKVQITLISRRIGSDNQYERMWISEISPSRTEIKTYPLKNSATEKSDIFTRYSIFTNNSIFRNDLIYQIPNFIEHIEPFGVQQYIENKYGTDFTETIRDNFNINIETFCTQVYDKFVEAVGYAFTNRIYSIKNSNYGKPHQLQQSLQLSADIVYKTTETIISELVDYFLMGGDTPDNIRLDTNRKQAIECIVEGFTTQFNKYEFDENQFLNHLLHIGEGNNHVITTWTGIEDDDFLKDSQLNKALVLKLYEPLPEDIQLNDKVWISKVLSESIIKEVELSDRIESYYNSLRGPNFGLGYDGGIEYQNFEKLFVVGDDTSTDLVKRYINGYGIDADTIKIDYADQNGFIFDNFIHFSSAEERIKNFWYKLQVLDSYNSRLIEIETQSSAASQIERVELTKKIDKLLGSMDGFEMFLYTSNSEFAYPKSSGTPVAITSQDAKTWYNDIVNKTSQYDRNNVNYLNNNIPEFIRSDYNNEEFMLFLDMIGHHFDTIWTYINGVKQLKELHQPSNHKQFRNLIQHMLSSLGWEGKKAFNANYLWEYALGKLPDGTQKYGITPKEASEEVWKRILHNMPYLLKHKGTARSIKAIIASYGIPNSLLTIMEFGGPHHPTDGEYNDFTFEDRTSAVHVKDGAHIIANWKSVGGQYPRAIEANVRPFQITTGNIISSGTFELGFEKISDNYAKLKLQAGSDSVESDPFKFSKEHNSNILVNAITGGYEVLLKTSNGYRIIRDIKLELVTGFSWATLSKMDIGVGFDGIIDEVRIWKEPLNEVAFTNHTKFPDAINGNTTTSYVDDLWFRLDFEVPRDLTSDPNIKNVAINQDYNEPYGVADSFYMANTYPYQYVPYDRTVTAKVPSVGFNYGNKIRFEDSELTGYLNYKSRATKWSFDRSPIDSNRLGLFLSANKELNMDVIKSIGPFHIGDYIGDPSYETLETYPSLDALRRDYFEQLNRNIYEYINLVRYIDKALFNNLEELLPARAKTATGLLIEPHILERNKVRWDRPISTPLYEETDIDVPRPEVISTYEKLETEVETDFTDMDAESIGLSATFVDNIYPDMGGDFVYYECEYRYDGGDLLTEETEKVKAIEIGMNDNSLYNKGFGLYSEPGMNGLGIVTKYFDNGDYKSGYKHILKVKKPTKNRYRVLDGNNYVFQDFDFDNYEVTLMDKEFVQDTVEPPINVPGYFLTEQYARVFLTDENGIILNDGNEYIIPGEVIPGETVVGSMVFTNLIGYFRTHYKFVNGLSLGLEQSYFNGSTQTDNTTPDGLPAVEVFTTNPNVVKVVDTGRTRGEPILRTT